MLNYEEADLLVKAAYKSVKIKPDFELSDINNLLSRMDDKAVKITLRYVLSGESSRAIAESYNCKAAAVDRVLIDSLNYICVAGKYDWFGDTYVFDVNQNIEVLGLSVPVARSLERSHVHTVHDLISLSESEVASLRTIGVKSLQEINDALQRQSISLRTVD